MMRPASDDYPFVRKALEFLHIDLARLADGGISLSVTATSVDEEEPQLLHQEIANERTTSIDETIRRLEQLVRASLQ